jgi:AcrR family transcriptional regulator
VVRPRAPVSSPSPSPRERSRLDVDERRAQLLAAALEKFAEHTYDDVSMDDVARTVGVSKGLLYHYFPTKRDLYVGALRLAASNLLAQTDFTGLSPQERVERSLETYLDFVEHHGSAYVALMRGGIGSDPEVSAVLTETRATFAARIVGDLPADLGTPLVRAALRGWIGFVEATSIDWVARREVPRAELLALLLGSLFDVVRRSAGEGSPLPALLVVPSASPS